MKNLVLFFILLGTLSTAYFLDRDENKLKSALIKKESLDMIKLENVELDLSNQEIFEKSRVNYILKRLLALNIVSRVDDIDFKEPLKTSITLQKDSKKRVIELRDLNPITGAFYIREENKTYLIEDTYVFEGFYKDERELFSKRYESLIHVLKQTREDFLKKRIFPDLVLEEMKVKNGVNREYTVNFLQSKTLPAPLGGLLYRDLKKIKEELEHISYKSIRSEITFASEISNIVFNKKLNFTILKNQEEYFVFYKNKYFEIQKENLSSLMSGVQDFWVKKIMLDFGDIIAQANNFFTLSFEDNEKIEFKLKSTEVFLYEQLEHKKFNPNYLNLLFNVILNNKPFEEAKYVLEHNGTNCKGTSLKVLDYAYCFIQKGADLYLQDEKNKIEYYYQSVLGAEISLKKNNFLIP